MAKSNYSFSSVTEFIGDNFGVILIAILFFMGGFFVGSLWTENQMATGGSPTKQVADAGAQPTGDGEESKLSKANLEKYALASAKNFDQNKFNTCVENNQFTQKVKDQFDGGSAAGINGTPGTVVVIDGQPKEIISGHIFSI